MIVVAVGAIVRHVGAHVGPGERTKADTAIVIAALELMSLPGVPSVRSSLTHNIAWRLAVLEALEASVASPVSSQAPILPYALRCFELGLNDPHVALQAICVRGMAHCSAVLHPRAPSVFAPRLSAAEAAVPHPLSLNNLHGEREEHTAPLEGTQ